ncbi:MAG: zeta toxin family protein, partial [Mucilaginibacter sp.]
MVRQPRAGKLRQCGTNGNAHRQIQPHIVSREKKSAGLSETPPDLHFPEEKFLEIQAALIERYTSDLRADKTPTVIILGGQPGAGKTELEKIAATELGGNVLACNADIFRDYHPHAKYIRANLEDQLPELTAPAAQRWNNAIRAYCEANRFNYILETTFSSGAMMNDTIKDLKTKGYRVGIKLLALHPKLSLLGTHLRFERGKSEEGTGRTVGKKVHDERFEKIIPTLTAVELAARYDKLELYGRDPEGVVLIVSNPPDAVKIYRWEIEKDWPDAIAQNFYD